MHQKELESSLDLSGRIDILERHSLEIDSLEVNSLEVYFFVKFGELGALIIR